MKKVLFLLGVISCFFGTAQTGAFKFDGSVVSGDTVVRVTQDLSHTFYKNFKFINASPGEELFKLRRLKLISTIDESQGHELIEYGTIGFVPEFVDDYVTLGSGDNVDGNGGEVMVNNYFSFFGPVSGELLMKYIAVHTNSGLEVDSFYVNYIWEDTTLSVYEEELEEVNLSIYPNPSSGIIQISNRNNQILHLFDTHGRELQSFNTDEMDLSSYSKGIYILKSENSTVKLFLR
jgi:uncharacterized protein YuzB (UPF0349 family)